MPRPASAASSTGPSSSRSGNSAAVAIATFAVTRQTLGGGAARGRRSPGTVVAAPHPDPLEPVPGVELLRHRVLRAHLEQHLGRAAAPGFREQGAEELAAQPA